MMKKIIAAGGMLLGAALLAPQTATSAGACGPDTEAPYADDVDAGALDDAIDRRAGDAPADPRMPGIGGTGAAGVPGKGEMGTGAPDPAADDPDIDRDGDVDAYDGAMEGSDRDIQAGDAPADSPDRILKPGRGGTGADTENLDHDPDLIP